MNSRLRWRKFVSGFMLTMTGVCALVSVSVLFFILGHLVYHGGTSISWNFFTKLPAPSAKRWRHGQRHSRQRQDAPARFPHRRSRRIPWCIYLAEFSGGATAFVVRYAADLLNGVPSIVIGIFAYSM